MLAAAPGKEEEAVAGWRRVLLVVLVIVCIPVVTVGMIILHEVGHTVVARVLGDGRATFTLYGSHCIGCNLYDSQRLSPLANVAVSLGGVLFTALATVAALGILCWRGRPSWLPRWLLIEVAAICFAGDFLWQIVQAVQLPVPAREPVGWGLGYTDLNAAVSFFSQATGLSHATAVAIGVAIGVLYTAGVALLARRAWRRGRPSSGRVSSDRAAHPDPTRYA
jgi:hypothetical protein